MERLAVIDLGSNSVRMSIFDIESNVVWRQSSGYRNMIKLSRGMTEDMMLQPDAQLRAVSALLEYKSILEKEGVTKVRIVATAAVRKAKNGKEFVKTVKDVTGFDIEVIDGETEAALDCLAISGTLGIDRAVVCDIGGGSTEFIAVADGVMQKPAISKPMGSRSITEMFLSCGETKEFLAEASAYVEKHVGELPWADKMQGVPIVGIGGTLRALAKYHINDEDIECVSRYSISAEEIDRIFELIVNSSPQERRNMPGIGEERADIIVGGLLPLMHLKKELNSPELIVSDVGVREGILFEYLKKEYKGE